MDMMERVESLMRARRINRKELAKRSEIPYTTLCGAVHGKWKGMRISTLVKLADYFHVSLDWLVYGSEEVNMERGRLIDVAKMALECADAMQEMSGMTRELGQMLMELSKKTDERKEGTP